VDQEQIILVAEQCRQRDRLAALTEQRVIRARLGRPPAPCRGAFPLQFFELARELLDPLVNRFASSPTTMCMNASRSFQRTVPSELLAYRMYRNNHGFP
jgi:hypothetical protein